MVGNIGASGHHGLDLGVQTPHETVLFLAVTVDMLGSILRQMIKLSNILHNRMIPLFQRKELL
jgi:hypothetical protein